MKPFPAPGVFGPAVRALAASVLALSLAGLAQAALPPFPPDDSIRAWLQERVDGHYAHGIIVGLLDHGTRRYVSAGAARDSVAGAPTPHTVFEIGSATKVFTATLLAEMAQRGDVRLDEPLQTFLPDSVMLTVRDSTPVTLAALATHTSGLPRMPANFTVSDAENPYRDYSVSALHTFLRAWRPSRAPGTKFEYSNLGAGLLGRALSRRAGKDYEALLTERVLRPLGLDDTRITLPDSWAYRLATPHSDAGDATAWWDLPTLPGAGALRSTAADMLAFLAAQLPQADGRLGAAVGLTQQPRAQASGDSTEVGLGWLIRHVPGGTIYWHNGGTGGFRSFLAFDREGGRGVVVLSNQATDVDDIGLHVLDATLLLARRPPRVRRPELVLSEEALERFVGEYTIAPTFAVTITRIGTRLFAQATSQPRFPVFAANDSTFFFKVVEAEMEFRRDASGAVTGMLLRQNGVEIPANRTK